MNKLRTLFASAPITAGTDAIGVGLAKIGQAAQGLSKPDNKQAQATLADAVRSVIIQWHAAGVDPQEAGQRAASVFSAKGSGTACRYALAAAAGLLALGAGTLDAADLPDTSIPNIEAAGIAATDAGYSDARKMAGDASQLLAKMAAQAGAPEVNVDKVVVSEAGASVYSASEFASQEMPDVDVSLRGAASIARRLQDPLAELVKIDPKSIQSWEEKNAMLALAGQFIERFDPDIKALID